MIERVEKVAIITGASRGMGRETAFRLADLGVSLFLVADGTEAELRNVVEECRGRSSSVEARYAVRDLSRLGAAEEMVAECAEAFGRIDVLINNAAVRCRKRFGEFTHEDFDLVQAVNIRTPFFACQAVLPIMQRQGEGRIINIGSQIGTAAFDDHALYGWTKAALIYLSRAIAYEWSKYGIQVNTVSPGPINTQYNLERLSNMPELRRTMESHVPLGRFGKPEEVAEVICFLATCQSRYIQGHDLVVDGGWLIN
jgi:NAD(P)-dependent dehydrogenase (short-subunit alcohol dehydrogenase family)